MYCTIQTVHTSLVSFLPSYQPFESHHLVRRHKLQWMMKVTITWLHNALFTKLYMQQALRMNSLTHTTYPHIYCTHALVIYTITCYVRTWDTLIYTYSSHNCIAGNGTSAYDMQNTTVCKNIIYVCISSCILYIAVPHCWAMCIWLLWRFSVQKDLFYK